MFPVCCFVLYLHFSSLVIRACYVFIKLKAQQESNKLSNNEKCLIPQEPYMPIFLKPSHEVRILNVNIVLFVCACMCVIWFTSGFESFQKNPRSKTLWAWMSPGSDSVAPSRAPGPRTLPGKCRARITSNVCSSSAYPSPVFCEAQMESDRRRCLGSGFGGIMIDMSIVHRWRTWTDILIDRPWLLFERCRSVRV